jgi:hypothetical protein
MADPTLGTVLAEGFIQIATQNGTAVALLAIAGAIGIMNYVIKQSSPVFNILFFALFITPVIILMSIYDKDYGKVAKDEAVAIFSYVRKNPKATKKIGIYFVAFLLSLASGLLMVYIEMVA